MATPAIVTGPRFSSRLLTCLFCLAILGGCAPSPERPELPQGDLSRAQELAEAGRQADAATLYLAAVPDTPPERRDALLLQAAEWFLEAGEPAQARGVLHRIQRDRLSRVDGIRRDLVAATLALARNSPAEALALLPLEALEIPPGLRDRYHGLRARALLADDQPFESARERMHLSQWVSGPDAIHANRESLMAALLRLSPREMERRMEALAPEDPMQGWLMLAYDMKTRLFEGEPMEEALARWRERFPQHPAGETLAGDLVERYRASFTYPTQVALVLPLSGRYESAARSIRDGFFAAWYGDQAERPAVRVYDATAHPQGVIGAYRQAANDGAGWVIGPLDRGSVESLLSQPALPVPVLAMNYAEGGAPASDESLLALRPGQEQGTGAPGLGPERRAVSPDGPATARARVYQFGLLPEQEARQVARRLVQDGRRRALVLAPRDEWGTRMMQAFVDEYTVLGGYVTDVARYDEVEADHSAVLRRLLALDESVRRARALERTIGRTVEFVPQARADTDALFLAARPRQARLIRPQLRFFEAVNLPVYGTSHLYGGGPAPANDNDLDGVMFCDAPWLLGTADKGPARGEIVQRFPDARDSSGRLFALGADAYRLIPYLDWLTDHPGDHFSGLSGRLSVDSELRLHRRLDWAQFRNGVPVPLSRAQSHGDSP